MGTTMDLGLAALTSDADLSVSAGIAGVAAALAAAAGVAAVKKWLSDLLTKKVTGPLGSNAGGIYKGADGVERYVKFYRDPAQAAGEHLANKVYELLGLDAVRSRAYPEKTDCGYVFTSEMVPGAQQLADVLGGRGGVKYAREFMKGFLADVLVANWDAVGLVHDNAMVRPDGHVVRVDNGGAFLMRAMGGRKPEHLLNDITEFDVFSSSRNPSYRAVMQKAGWIDAAGNPTPLMEVEVNAQKENIKAHCPEGLESWATSVLRETSATPQDRKRMLEMLKSRYKLISWLVPGVSGCAHSSR